MKRTIVIATATVLCLSTGIASAQQPAPAAPVAGKVPLGVTVTEMENVVVGWSSKKDLVGKTVVNDKNDKIGKIEDIIISPKNYVSYAIVGVGGFVGIGKHDVAIPMEQIKITSGNLVLAGATKDSLKALPAFEYTKKK